MRLHAFASPEGLLAQIGKERVEMRSHFQWRKLVKSWAQALVAVREHRQADQDVWVAELARSAWDVLPDKWHCQPQGTPGGDSLSCPPEARQSVFWWISRFLLGFIGFFRF